MNREETIQEIISLYFLGRPYVEPDNFRNEMKFDKMSDDFLESHLQYMREMVAWVNSKKD